MSELEALILKALSDDHKCIHHAGANSGPCRTCRRRAEIVVRTVVSHRGSPDRIEEVRDHFENDRAHAHCLYRDALLTLL